MACILRFRPAAASGGASNIASREKKSACRWGVYPEVNLKRARARTIEARQLLDAGVDPSENRRAAKAAQMDGTANSFEVVTREWIE
jgi:Arm domain-containing DNA-binding protein